MTLLQAISAVGSTYALNAGVTQAQNEQPTNVWEAAKQAANTAPNDAEVAQEAAKAAPNDTEVAQEAANTAPNDAKVAQEAANSDNQPKAKKGKMITKYGKTRLPKGTELLGTNTRYSYGRYYNDDDSTTLIQMKVGKVRLPNGVEVEIQKDNYSAGKGRIIIDPNNDNRVTFDNVPYTTIIGTDDDDIFEFKNNPELDGVDRFIETRRGNDTVVNPSAITPGFNPQYGHVQVVSDGNLVAKGNVWNVAFRANGFLDTTRATTALRNHQDEPNSAVTKKIDTKM